ncbi:MULTISPECIES: SCO3242 family prenyltransferase [unclassified Isoptericola]|uniref:SCO3242 family prenyltransferase n=1 Tax=unclassified Isoptericola TaxID=2623355 RepID=UPI0036668BEF
MTPRDVAELVRAPAALSVLGDTLAGMASAPGRIPARRRVLLPTASACLYLGGMALNDYADRDLDAIERPERPIPSGRVTPRQALGTGAALTGAGVTLAALGGGRKALAVAVPLAACVLTYDLVAKDSPSGPLVMAACRGLDVLLGAAPTGVRPALPAAAALAVHTLGVTVLSRGEVHGTTTAVGTSAAVTSAVVAAGTVAAALARPAAGPAGRWARRGAVAAASAYAAACLPGQVRAARDRSAGAARSATKAGIQAMVPLQAAWALRGGRLEAVALAGVAVVGGALLRRRGRVSIT